MPTNAIRPTVASKKLFIFSSPFPLASIVPTNGVAGVALIPTCNVNPMYFRRKDWCQNGNTQEQLASAALLAFIYCCVLIIVHIVGTHGRAVRVPRAL
jgi:hypothetical protein